MALKYVRFCVEVFKLVVALSMVLTCPIWFFAKLCFDYDIVEATTTLFNNLDELVDFYYK